MQELEISYVVIDEIDITDVMIEESFNGHSTYRKSIDKTKAILKFSKMHPDTMGGRTKRTFAQMEQYIADNFSVWNITTVTI